MCAIYAKIGLFLISTGVNQMEKTTLSTTEMQNELAHLVDSGVTSVIEAYIDALTPQQMKYYLLSHWKQNADDGILFDSYPVRELTQ